MLFNSLSFLIFFPVVTAAYFVARRVKARVVLLLVASCIFYMAFVPSYILILAFTIGIDYGAGIFIAGASNKHRRRMWLLASLVANVGVLAVFKYYAFIIDNAVDALGLIGWNVAQPTLRLILPIGLSFHTFQAMSYTIEVYRGRQPPERNLVVYALYVMFYPQLVAGPIERPQNLLPQFRIRHEFDYDRVTSGLRRMAWGMFKKVVVADRLAVVADIVFDNPHAYHGMALIVATVMFSFQIYFDFSAYSDIALGSARVMGFELMENFRTPYWSRSVSEFWRRWHISLSTWFKDYVYVPLGGSRVNKVRHYRNIMVVFALSGLWHGASWTFVVWGVLHGTFLIASDVTTALRRRVRETLGVTSDGGMARGLAIGSTFIMVALAWIFFRAKTFAGAVYIITHIGTGLAGDIVNVLHGQWGLPGVGSRFLMLAGVLAVESVWGSWRTLDAVVLRARPIVRYSLYILIVYGTVFSARGGAAQQFIYFQF